jgi:hypothetical protein
MFRSSSERYEANCDRRFRMHYRNGYVPEQSERNKPLFPVREPIVFECERRSDKHLRRVDEIQAVGLQVRLAFTFIPLKLHLRSVYTWLTQSKRRARLRIYNPPALASWRMSALWRPPRGVR